MAAARPCKLLLALAAAAQATVVLPAPAGLSQYERERLGRIARNEACMQSLGLGGGLAGGTPGGKRAAASQRGVPRKKVKKIAASVKGECKDKWRSMVSAEFGRQADFTTKLFDKSPAATRYWQNFLDRFFNEMAVILQLSNQTRRTIALEHYDSIKLVSPTNNEAVAKFVEDYAGARGMSIRYGVITEDPVGFDREYTEFKKRLKGSELLEHLRLHLATPTSMYTRTHTPPPLPDQVVKK